MTGLLLQHQDFAESAGRIDLKNNSPTYVQAKWLWGRGEPHMLGSPPLPALRVQTPAARGMVYVRVTRALKGKGEV